MKSWICIGLYAGLYIFGLMMFSPEVLFAQEPDFHKDASAFEINRLELLSEEAEAYKLSNPSLSLKKAKEAIEIAQKLEDVDRELDLMILIGTNLNRLYIHREAIEVGEEIIKKATAAGLRKYEALGKTVIAVAFAEVGNFDQSSNLYFENLKYYESIGDEVSMGFTLGNIGADFLSQENYEKAYTFTKRALEIAEKLNNQTLATDQYNNMAVIYQLGYKDYHKAIEFYKKAYQIAIETNDSIQQGRTSLNLAQIFTKINKADSAQMYNQHSLAIFKKLKNYPLIASAYLNYAELFQSIDIKDSTIFYAQQALTLSQNYGMIYLSYNAAGILYFEYLQKSDTIQAFKYLKIQSGLADSLNSLQSQKSLYRLELLYNQEKKAKAKETKQQMTYFFIAILIIILIAIIVIIFLNYSRQKAITKSTILEKEQIENKLDFKRKELSSNLMALINKSELLTFIISKLTELENKSKPDGFRKSVTELKREIKLKNDDTLWNEFSVRLNETNNSFYERLLTTFPGLTKNELKLCAYLRLNMSTKDISKLTGQRPQTIDHARYRLRRKMGLSNTETDLVTFLSQF
ncbi:Tetratricopeptide repeat protein [anaerobic digester metagenome]|jgi:tetratricopeptide (TPR) repeat protein